MTYSLDELMHQLKVARRKGTLDELAQAYYLLGKFYHEEGDYAKAKLNYVISLKTMELPLVSYSLAQVEIELEHYDLARKSLKQELRINPRNTKAKELSELLYVESNIPLITVTLFLLNLGIFISTYPMITFPQVLQFGAQTFSFHWSSVITSLFFHLNIYHFSLNMLFLLMIGFVLEKHIGSLRFLLIYLISGIVGNLAGAFFISPSIVLGASSALFGLVGALLMREPLMNIRFFGLFKVPMILFFAAFFSFMFLMQIASLHATFALGDLAHISGFLLGIFCLACFYPSTISVFYYWMFIAGGFWLFVEGLMNLINSDYLYGVIYVFISIFLMIYSYKQLLDIRGTKVDSQ